MRLRSGYALRTLQRRSGLTVALIIVFSSCATFQRVRTSEISIHKLDFGYPVVGDNQLDLNVHGKKRGLFMLLMEGVSQRGFRFRSERNIRLPESGRGRFKLRYSVVDPGLYEVNLRIYDLRKAEMVFESKEHLIGVQPKWEFTHDRSYYTTENEIRFRSRMNRSEKSGSLVVELAMGDSTIWRQKWQPAAAQIEGVIPGNELAPGEYELFAQLQYQDDVYDSTTVLVRKLVPVKHEVKLDLFTNSILKDGVPFFPLGIYWLREETLAEATRLGFNSGDYYYKLDDEAISQLMEKAAKEQLGILLEFSNHVRNLEVPDTTAIYEKVLRYRNHPALLAWYLVDEPADAEVNPRDAERLYNRIRQLDPYHPVLLVNNRPHTFVDYIKSSDILAIDPYPVPNYPISRVSEYSVRAAWSGIRPTPVWLVVQAFGGVEHWPRAPTAAELRNMVYQGIVNGTRGVLFYRFCGEEEREIQPLPLWQEVKELTRELGSLATILVANDVTRFLQRIDGSADLQVAVRESNNDFYLFMVNPTGRFLKARFRLERVAPVVGFEGIVGHSSLIIDPDGDLHLELGPLGMGVYRLLTAGV